MACHWMKLPDGTVVHLNMGRQNRELCPFCKSGWVTKLCDFEIQLLAGQKRTCDLGMCDRCAHTVSPGVEHCPKHKPEVRA